MIAQLVSLIHQKRVAVLPLGLTLLRVVLAPVIILISLDGRAGIPYLVCLIVAFGSDYFDGVVARRFGVATAALRRLDTIADIIFYAAAGGAVWLVRPDVILANLTGIAVIIGLELGRLALDYLKFRREASYHMWSAKAWGLSVVAALFVVMGFDAAEWLFGLAVWVGMVANVEGLLTSLVLPTWTHDVPTVWHAWRIRQQSSLTTEW